MVISIVMLVYQRVNPKKHRQLPSAVLAREALTAVEGLKVSEVALEVTEAWGNFGVPNSDGLGLLKTIGKP